MVNMTEIEELFIKGCVLSLLAWNAAVDLRKREICLKSLAIYGFLGIGGCLWLPGMGPGPAAAGLSVGLLLLAAAFLTREAVGVGDGLLLCVTGLYLGFWENLRLLFTGILLTAAAGAALLLLRKRLPKDRVPFVPFLLAAYLGRVFL